MPPNTPNEASRTSSYSDSNPLDSPVPGHVQRVGSESQQPFSNLVHDPLQHIQLHQTSSLPLSAFDVNSFGGVGPGGMASSSSNPVATGESVDQSINTSRSQQPPVNQIDPADKECLERFLKINVRHITDGQGVVSGVLLVTPNALMFDPNVSDPLVIEHGAEIYGVTVPMELVLKTALYTDIAHMRVKHAPEAVPSVPKPSVYYATEDDTGCIFEDTLRSVYGKKSATQFDTIQQDSQELELAEELIEPEQFVTDTDKLPDQSNPECDDTNLEANENMEKSVTDVDQEEGEDEEESSSIDVFKDAVDRPYQEESNCDVDIASKNECPVEQLIKFDDEPDDQTAANIQGMSIPKTSVDEVKDESIEEMTTEATESFEQSKSIDTNSIDDISSQSNYVHSNNRLSSHFQAKLALSERHSAPLSTNDKIVTPPLLSAVSAEETEVVVNKRLSAHGESRREQMLKRLSNPVDTIGSLTKSGISSGINVTKSSFNATKSGINSGISATKTGLMATKSSLTSATKTGFNKVLSTPKNLMDFSTGLVQGALGSKSDNNIHEHLQDESPKSKQFKKSKDPLVGYTNMVDTKVDAFENFDSEYNNCLFGYKKS